MDGGLREAISQGRSIGLALGGGAARGCAHVGVLRAFQEKGITLSCVAGTSIGAMIGAVYASGGLDHLEALLLELDPLHLLAYFDVVFPHSGLVDGRKVTELLREILGDRSFKDLSMPFAAVATDIRDGREVAISSGDVIDAVRASIAVPGVFTPFMSGEAVLVDGGLVNPVPVNVARSLGADFVVAVDLNRYVVESKQDVRCERPLSYRKGQDLSLGNRILEEIRALVEDGSRSRPKPPNIVDVIVTSINIMETSITQSRLKTDPPDLLLAPRLGNVRFMEFFKAKEAMEAGYRVAIESL
ncbi:patatin-like phospholipase family protein [Dethiosulfovibrio salsuginis]|uniref:NTE family protein n=1 Tax=Dethiosulfovibrio salsuginis TaxID=561720 RepID=A0A1X7KE22_9BACT|nr:patatin-like phospholipase family protein [Dethiosulfovibrio salsuginis]SMG39508.1 NTE family protein [Dethiosulfovibrio salsuginis]